jgi:predicted aspartyl protease
MGEIVVRIELENVVDRDRATAGDIPEATVRSYTMSALVGTGAVMLSLPQDVVEHVGLKIRRTVVVTYTDERKEERPVAGPVTVKIGERFMNTGCIVGPPLSEALIGQVILEELDLRPIARKGYSCQDRNRLSIRCSSSNDRREPLLGDGFRAGIRPHSYPHANHFDAKLLFMGIPTSLM